jgi:hypothetical protein
MDLVNAVWDIVCKNPPKSIHEEGMRAMYSYHGPVLPALIMPQEVVAHMTANESF